MKQLLLLRLDIKAVFNGPGQACHLVRDHMIIEFLAEIGLLDYDGQ